MNNKPLIVPSSKGFRLARPSSEAPIDHLAAGVYNINVDDMGVALVRNADAMPVVSRSYGTTETERTNRIVKHYDLMKDKAPYGVMLAGSPGSGKTRLSNRVANRFIKKGFPVILVNQAYPASLLTNVAEALGKCVFVYDEVTITYPTNDGVNALEELTRFLSDQALKGVVNIMTTNNIHWIPSQFHNRTGRLYWNINFHGASMSEIEDVFSCYEDLPDTFTLVKILKAAQGLTVDNLVSISEVYKLHGNLMDTIVDLEDMNIPNILPTVSVRSNGATDEDDAPVDVTYVQLDLASIEITAKGNNTTETCHVDLTDSRSKSEVTIKLATKFKGLKVEVDTSSHRYSPIETLCQNIKTQRPLDASTVRPLDLAKAPDDGNPKWPQETGQTFTPSMVPASDDPGRGYAQPRYRPNRPV